MENIDLPDNISTIQTNIIKYILKVCPDVNMERDIDYTLIDIVLHMDNLAHFTRIIKFVNEGFEENEIISIINKSDNLIKLMYELINSGVERENTTALICLSEEDIQIAVSFIKDYHINDSILSDMLYNKFENTFPRIKRLLERGITCFDTAYCMAGEDNDTEENINKMMKLISDGMNWQDAYNNINK
jgi:hypothetical protein